MRAPTAAGAPPGEEWYVGIGGSPLGPVPLAVIREKALAGDVDGDSLVWREGLDEWKPLKSSPELLAMLAEVHAARPGAVPPLLAMPPLIAAPPPLVAAPPPLVAPSPIAVELLFAAAPMPTAPVAPAGLSAALPAPEPTAAPVSGAAPDVDLLAESFFRSGVDAPPESSPPSGLTTLSHPSSPVVPLDSSGSRSGPPSEPEPLVAQPGELVEPLLPIRRRGTSPLVYALVAMAAAFGGVSAYVLLSPRQPPPLPPAPLAAAPQQAPPQTGPAEGLPPPPVIEEEAPAPAASPGAAVRPGGPVGSRPAGSAAPIDTSGFSNPGAPGPASTEGSSPGLSQLSQAQIQRVVSTNSPGIKRRCWQPALESRGGVGPANARVMASVTITPSGAVQSASASGGERDFPGLASCIAARIKTWQFPPSSGSTPVNIPFVFAGQ